MRLYDQDKNDTTILGQYRRVRMHTPANSLQRPWARVIMKPLAEVGFSEHGMHVIYTSLIPGVLTIHAYLDM